MALAGAGILAYAVFRLASLVPGAVEAVYGGRLGAALAWPLSRISGLVPFALAELLVLAFLARQAAGGGIAVWHLARRRRHWRNALAAGGLRLAQDAGVLLALFDVLWGFNYARPALAERAGLPALDSVTVDEVAALTREAVDATNAAYRALHGADDAGRPTRGTAADRDPLYDALATGWEHVRDSLGLDGAVRWTYGRPKSFLFSTTVARFGTSGMYFPYTGEALVVAGLPAISYPKSVAHEQAHQRGITHEGDANFLGYLAALWAPDPHARYSSHAFAARQLLPVLARADRERGRAEAARLLPGVRRDLEDLRQFWAQFEGPLESVGTRVNDAYLRTQRIPEGVLAYSRSVELLIAFARSRAPTSGPNP